MPPQHPKEGSCQLDIAVPAIIQNKLKEDAWMPKSDSKRTKGRDRPGIFGRKALVRKQVDKPAHDGEPRHGNMGLCGPQVNVVEQGRCIPPTCPMNRQTTIVPSDTSNSGCSIDTSDSAFKPWRVTLCPCPASAGLYLKHQTSKGSPIPFVSRPARALHSCSAFLGPFDDMMATIRSRPNVASDIPFSLAIQHGEDGISAPLIEPVMIPTWMHPSARIE